MPSSLSQRLSLMTLLGWMLCLLIAIPAQALDTSSGVGLQDRALFQERLDYTLTNQNGKDFHAQDLSNTSFAGAVARAANFSNSNLRGAILTQGTFTQSNFSGADLSDALMDRVDFVDTDLRNTLLKGVIASGSSFAGAQIEGADFSNALLDQDDQRRLCLEADGINPITGIATYDSLYC